MDDQIELSSTQDNISRLTRLGALIFTWGLASGVKIPFVGKLEMTPNFRRVAMLSGLLMMAVEFRNTLFPSRSNSPGLNPPHQAAERHSTRPV